jgi:hypothetical protein
MEMGGMFSVVKVREGLARDDYADPGPYKNPDGTVAYLFKGDTEPAPRAPEKRSSLAPAVEFDVVKPRGGAHKGEH